MILALDLGSRVGVAQGDGSRAPLLDTWLLPTGGGAEVGAFFNAFHVELSDRVLRHCPTLIVYEAPFLSATMMSNAHTVRRLYGLPAFVEQIAWRNSIEVAEAHIGAVRKTFGVKPVPKGGRAEDRRRALKAAVIAAARARGFDPANDHEADAAAVWFHALAVTDEARAARFDPLAVAAQRAEAQR